MLEAFFFILRILTFYTLFNYVTDFLFLTGWSYTSTLFSSCPTLRLSFPRPSVCWFLRPLQDVGVGASGLRGWLVSSVTG